MIRSVLAGLLLLSGAAPAAALAQSGLTASAARPGRVPRALQGAGGDQHHALGRRLHAGRQRMAARLKAAGLPEGDLHLFAAPDHPKEGGLVAVYPGTRSQGARPILLLAHIDVVEAKREDWTRDPFTLVEENGYFYARGVGDDKAQAAIWVDTLIRFKQEGYKPRRTLKMALTCGEETGRRVQRRRISGRRTSAS